MSDCLSHKIINKHSIIITSELAWERDCSTTKIKSERHVQEIEINMKCTVEDNKLSWGQTAYNLGRMTYLEGS